MFVKKDLSNLHSFIFTAWWNYSPYWKISKLSGLEDLNQIELSHSLLKMFTY